MTTVIHEDGYSVVVEVPDKPGFSINHPKDGIFFTKTQSGESVVYKTTRLTSKEDAEEGFKKPNYKYTLVRGGKENQWFYYPLQLVFATRQERLSEAARRQRKPPRESWVRRKQRVIRRLFELE